MITPTKTILTRRNVLRGMFAMPAIVAFDHIMPVKLFVPPPVRKFIIEIEAINDEGKTIIFAGYKMVSEHIWTAPFKGKSQEEAGIFYQPEVA